MRRSPHVLAATRVVAGILLLSSGLAGCSIPLQSAGPQPDEAAVAACNSRADEVFLRQNRDALYRSDRYTSSIRDSPYAAAGLPETSAGLSAQYGRNQDVRSCLNGASTPSDQQPAATAVP